MIRTLSRVEVAERMTSREFFRRAPEDRKAELIDGVMIVPSPPLDIHERLLIFLIRLLGEFIESYNLGELRGSRTAVELEEDQTYEPDIVFVARDRVGIVKEDGVFGAPDLIVEILSASTAPYDRGAKFRAYERAGVGELWLIDPHGPAGTEFYRRKGRILQPVMPDEAGVLHSVAVPGFKLRTAWLWPVEKFVAIRDALKEMGAP